ncbi:MAG: hypothetical protein JXB13_16310, partial [Phycisphaerae bacterium]|nr:hypothetical protein [Phycisphaerae bacterium]
ERVRTIAWCARVRFMTAAPCLRMNVKNETACLPDSAPQARPSFADPRALYAAGADSASEGPCVTFFPAGEDADPAGGAMGKRFHDEP